MTKGRFRIDIVISSPRMNKAMIMKILDQIKGQQLDGVTVNVITIPAEEFQEKRVEATRTESCKRLSENKIAALSTRHHKYVLWRW